jgi:hypothetical protein
MNTPEEQARLQAAFDSSNAINDLAGVQFTEEMRDMQRRVIVGEITFYEAIKEITHGLKIAQNKYRQ